jgi:plasmid maintenance system antidote protein VapI
VSVAGAQLLKSFLEKHGLSHNDCAVAIGAVRPSVTEWLNSVKRPEVHFRRALETWTAGAVSIDAWETTEERVRSAAVVPFQPAVRDATSDVLMVAEPAAPAYGTRRR